MGGGISSGTVKETVDYCLQVDLFDKRLFDEWGVLTSRGIQRRFWTVLSERRNKTVYSEYWLLKPEECKGLVKVSLISNVQPTNDHLHGTDNDSPPIKESKVNKKIYIAFQPEVEQAFQLYLLVRENNYGSIIPEQVEALREELVSLTSDPGKQLTIVKKATSWGTKGFEDTDKKTKSRKPQKSKFNNYTGRDYDMNALELQMLGGNNE